MRNGDPRLLDRLALRGTQMRGELGDRRVEIDVLHGYVRQPAHAPDGRAEARHQQRVRAQIVEEVVLHRHAVGLHDLGQRARQRFLHLVPWRDEVASRSDEARARGRRQGLAVHLVAARHRDGGELLEVGGHHVARQMRAQRLPGLAQRQRVRRPASGRSRRRARRCPAAARRCARRLARSAAAHPPRPRSRPARCGSRGS